MLLKDLVNDFLRSETESKFQHKTYTISNVEEITFLNKRLFLQMEGNKKFSYIFAIYDADDDEWLSSDKVISDFTKEKVHTILEQIFSSKATK